MKRHLTTEGERAASNSKPLKIFNFNLALPECSNALSSRDCNAMCVSTTETNRNRTNPAVLRIFNSGNRTVFLSLLSNGSFRVINMPAEMVSIRETSPCSTREAHKSKPTAEWSCDGEEVLLLTIFNNTCMQ